MLSGIIRAINKYKRGCHYDEQELDCKARIVTPCRLEPEAAHADVRAQIEDAIAKRLTEIIATVADFGFESATVNLHDLQDFVRDVVIGYYQFHFRKNPALREQLVLASEMPLSVFNTLVQSGVADILDNSDFEYSFHTDGEVQIFWN